jgi:general secretion pathway protein D
MIDDSTRVARPVHGRRRPWSVRTAAFAWVSMAVVAALAGCANNAVEQAVALSQDGHPEEALAVLQRAQTAQPDDITLRSALARQREATIVHLLYLADGARARGAVADAESLLARIDAVSPRDPRTLGLRRAMARDEHARTLLAEAQAAWDAGHVEAAQAAWRAVLAEDPSNGAARAGLAKAAQTLEAAARRDALSRPSMPLRTIDLDFREAPLRTVLDAIARETGQSFAFDKDVKTDARVSVSLHGIDAQEALSVVLSTQALQSKLINSNTLLIFQATQQKQHDFQDQVTRTFYLVNADPKQVQALVKSMTKAREVFVEERLSLVVVQDTPEVIRLAEKLIEAIDLPEPEVMLEVSVLEVSSSRVSQLGLSPPQSVNFGLPNGATTVTQADRFNLIAWVANPLAVANLTADVTHTNVLANPKIRVKNREKAHVQVGEKLPVFTAIATANVGTASSVNYLDVGLKLDLEPQVQLDGEVNIRVALEVSSAGASVSSVDGQATAYPINTRQANTSLRLHDGETEILAGLINDSDLKENVGVPGASEVPLLGYLFGNHKADDKKTEVVLLITPHVLRSVPVPSDTSVNVPSGTEGRLGLTATRGEARAAASSDVKLMTGMTTQSAHTPAPAALVDSSGVFVLEGPDAAAPGSLVQVMVRGGEAQAGLHDLRYDERRLAPLATPSVPGTLQIEVPSSGQRAFMFRVLTAAPPGIATFGLGASTLQVRIQRRP